MNRIGGALLVTLLAAAAAGCGSGGGGTVAATGVNATTAAPSASPASKITRSQLAQGTMPDSLHITSSAPSQLVVQQVTIQPGGLVPWHTHPGWENTVVTGGELTLTISTNPGCAPRHLGPSQAFDVPARTPHTATNAGTVPVVLVVTYLAVPPGATLATPVARPVGCTG